MAIGINPYIITNGNGKEVAEFYKNAIGAELLTLQTYGDLPESPEHPIAEGQKDLVVHAHLKIGGSDLMLSDAFPGQPYIVGSNVTIAIHLSDADEAKRIYANLAEGGEETLPLQETFFSPAYGQVIDRNGVQWHVSAAGQRG